MQKTNVIKGGKPNDVLLRGYVLLYEGNRLIMLL